MKEDTGTYVEARDGVRIAKQRRLVHAVMADGQWHTLQELGEGLRYPEASVSARIRDLRKARYGGHTVERRYLGNGLWHYRLVVEQ